MREKKTDQKPLKVIPEKMVTLTSEAAEKIKNALQRYAASGVRIQVTQNERGGVSFSLDIEEKAQLNDLVLQDKGIKLFVDPSSTQYVQGIEIRYVKTEKGSGFAIVNAGTG
jgi:iron-sulfur cluster assembly protein